MRRTVLPPLVALALCLVGFGVAVLLDSGDAGSRDAALLVGVVALWGAAAATLWLLVALGYVAYQRRRAGGS